MFDQGRAKKLLDVSEYMKQGNDNRWEYLKEGYQEHYHLFDGKAIPHILTVALFVAGVAFTDLSIQGAAKMGGLFSVGSIILFLIG